MSPIEKPNTHTGAEFSFIAVAEKAVLPNQKKSLVLFLNQQICF